MIIHKINTKKIKSKLRHERLRNINLLTLKVSKRKIKEKIKIPILQSCKKCK